MLVGRSILFAAILLPVSLSAHHSVEDTIRELSQKITQKPTAELYFKRAIEYRALRKSPECKRDLRAALRLSPTHYSSKIALTRLLMTLGKYEEARTCARELQAEAKDSSRIIEVRFLRAGLAHALNADQEALKMCEEIQKEFPKHDESIDLFQAYLLVRNERAGEAAQLLRRAYERSEGVVLRNSWIDASLAAGDFGKVWPIIQKELADSRFKAAWLIRRARVAQMQGEADRMRKDLQTALIELKTRINPDRPDLTLVSDRGLALAMLGHKEQAGEDLALLRASGFPTQSYLFLEQLLKD